MKTWQVPGLAVAILVEGKIVYIDGFGWADREARVPVRQDTLFPIAQNSQAFTAVLLASLAEEGRLAWDNPVHQVLPRFRLQDPLASAHTTPRDLLVQNVGLPRHMLMWYATPFTRNDLLQRMRFLDANYGFRRTFQNSELLTMVAGMMAEKVSATSFDTLLAKRIFQPLSMGQTATTSTLSANNRQLAQPYRLVGDKLARGLHRKLDNMDPACGVVTSIADMAQWLRFWQTGRAPIIEAPTLAGLLQPQIPAPNYDDTHIQLTSYAMGWRLSMYRGQRLHWHTGALEGFFAYVGWLPKTKFGLVVLMNRNEPALAETTARYLYDHMASLPFIDWHAHYQAQAGKTATDDSTARPITGTQPSQTLDAYTGLYENPGYGELRINREGEGLKAIYYSLTSALDHQHYDVFSATEDLLADKTFQFEADRAGRIARVTVPFQTMVAPIVFSRKAGIAPVGPAQLQRYLGQYKTTDTTFTIKLNPDGQLMVLMPAHPAFSLAHDSAHRFLADGLDGFAIQFTVVDDRVTGASITRGTHRVKAIKLATD